MSYIASKIALTSTHGPTPSNTYLNVTDSYEMTGVLWFGIMIIGAAITYILVNKEDKTIRPFLLFPIGLGLILVTISLFFIFSKS